MARIPASFSHNGGRRGCWTRWPQPVGQLERQRHRRFAEVEFVAAEAVEVLVQVGAGAGQCLRSPGPRTRDATGSRGARRTPAIRGAAVPGSAHLWRPARRSPPGPYSAPSLSFPCSWALYYRLVHAASSRKRSLKVQGFGGTKSAGFSAQPHQVRKTEPAGSTSRS